MIASALNAAERGDVMTSSPGPMPSPLRISASASVPFPTPTACRAPCAAANSASNDATSGPSTYQPLATTRAMAAATAAASSLGAGDPNEMRERFTSFTGARSRVLRRANARVHVAVEMPAVVVHGRSQPVAERRGGGPAGCLAEFGRIGIEVADVDRFLLGRPVDVLDA